MTAQLPTIDFTSPDADQAFVASLREFGFGVLANHPLDMSLINRIYADWEGFFSTSAKWDYEYSRHDQDGFFSTEVSEQAKGHHQKDIKEYFHYYAWGRCPEHLREDLHTYYASAVELAARLLGWVQAYSPADVLVSYREALPQMIDNSQQNLLRVLHYPPMQGDEAPDAVRAAAHSDINLLTVLPAASEAGLQIQAQDGSWLDVPADPATLVVNIGDMLQEASNHWFPSTMHRVLNPVGSDRTVARMSLPLFLHPRPDVVLSDRYTAEEYLAERLRELGVV